MAASDGGGTSLPIRDLGDERLADQVRSDACPLCLTRDAAVSRYLEVVLDESVNDLSFRARLDRGRGFCRRHSRDVLDASRDAGGLLGGAILLGAGLRVRLTELDALPRQSGRGVRHALALARTPPECPVCEQVATAERHAVDSLLAKLEDDAWRGAVASAAFCLDDLLILWEAATRSGTRHWAAVSHAQLARIRDTAERLGSFAHHSSFDRRHLQTDAERRAPTEAARLLGGSGAPVERSRA
jgi:hypothetical protein